MGVWIKSLEFDFQFIELKFKFTQIKMEAYDGRKSCAINIIEL